MPVLISARFSGLEQLSFLTFCFLLVVFQGPQILVNNTGEVFRYVFDKTALVDLFARYLLDPQQAHNHPNSALSFRVIGGRMSYWVKAFVIIHFLVLLAAITLVKATIKLNKKCCPCSNLKPTYISVEFSGILRTGTSAVKGDGRGWCLLLD